MGAISFIRLGVLGLTAIFSAIGMAISANLLAQEQQYLRSPTFCSLGIAAGAISLVTLPVMLVIDIIRRGAFTSMIVVEVVWLYILSILWVATGGTASQYNPDILAGCNYKIQIYISMCQEFQAIQAFSFLNFIILFVYASVIIIMAIVAESRGERVWLSSVKESFGSLGPPGQYPMNQYNSSAPPPTAAHTPQPGAV